MHTHSKVVLDTQLGLHFQSGLDPLLVYTFILDLRKNHTVIVIKCAALGFVAEETPKFVYAVCNWLHNAIT